MLAGNGDTVGYLLTLAMLSAYTVLLVFLRYRIARSCGIGFGWCAAAKDRSYKEGDTPTYGRMAAATHLRPNYRLLLRRRLRYAMRNAQLRMMASHAVHLDRDCGATREHSIDLMLV